MCTPSILFVLITGLIGYFQYFTIPWVMTQGGPMQSTEVYSIYLYQTAFMFLKALPKVIGVFVGALAAIYLVAYVWVYGFIPDLISSIVHRIK